MATKPPPLPPDARRPKRADDDDAPDTDPDNPPLPPLPAARAAPRRPPHAPPAPPPLPPRVSARPAGVPAPARAGRALARAGADAPTSQIEVSNRSDGGFFYWLLHVLRLRPAVRARPARHGRVRDLHLLRGDAAHAARHRDLSRGGRDDDRDARRGRHAARRAGQRAPRDPVVRALPPAARAGLPGHRGSPLLRAPGPRLPRHRGAR